MTKDIFDLSKRKTSPKDVEKAVSMIFQKLKDGKKKKPKMEKYFIICLFAGHGLLKEGM